MSRLELLDVRMMVFRKQSTVPSVAPVLLSQCVNPDQLKIERLKNNLRPCGKGWLTSLEFSFLMKMTKLFSFSQRSMLAHKFSASEDRRKGIGKPVFKLAPHGSGQTFTLVTPDLSVPGISPEVFTTGSLSS